MMDAHDTNQPLNQGELEEEKKTVEVSEAITETPSEETTAEVQPEAAPKPATKEDVLNQLKELAQDAENANKQDIDNHSTSYIMPSWKLLRYSLQTTVETLKILLPKRTRRKKNSNA